GTYDQNSAAGKDAGRKGSAGLVHRTGQVPRFQAGTHLCGSNPKREHLPEEVCRNQTIREWLIRSRIEQQSRKGAEVPRAFLRGGNVDIREELPLRQLDGTAISLTR